MSALPHNPGIGKLPSASMVCTLPKVSKDQIRDNESCTICLQKLSDYGGLLRMACGVHIYHINCAERVLSIINACPECRTAMATELDAEDGVATMARQKVRRLLNYGRFKEAACEALHYFYNNPRKAPNKVNDELMLVALGECCLRLGFHGIALSIFALVQQADECLSELQKAILYRLKGNAYFAFVRIQPNSRYESKLNFFAAQSEECFKTADILDPTLHTYVDYIGKPSNRRLIIHNQGDAAQRNRGESNATTTRFSKEFPHGRVNCL